MRSGWKALLFALAAGVCNGAAAGLWQALPWPGAAPWLPLAGFSFLAVLGLTWACLQLEGRPLGSIGLGLDRRWGRQFLAGALAGAGLIALMALAGYLGGGFHLVHNPAASLTGMAAGTWLYLAVAFSEELLFRGYPFQRLVAGLGPWPALALTAVLFAGAHWGNQGMSGATRAWACLNLAIASILLGLCWLRTRSLALPIGLHLGWNWTQGMLLGFGVSGNPSAGWWMPVFHGRPDWVAGGTFGLEASLPCCAVGLLACLALAAQHRQE